MSRAPAACVSPLFGTVTPDGMAANDVGRFVAEGIALDAHIVMPDHVHAIITPGTNPQVETTPSIPDIFQRFKTKVMESWPGGVRTRGWALYDAHLWHTGQIHPRQSRSLTRAQRT